MAWRHTEPLLAAKCAARVQVAAWFILSARCDVNVRLIINRSVIERIIQRDSHPTKAPAYDLITGKILQELPRKGLRAITQIHKAIFRLEYFPCHWKTGQILMIAKPGKNPTEVTSCRPISLLPLLFKILEKIILKRLAPILAVNSVIPSHQFGFRPKHGTVQQVHRIIHRINNDLQNKRYCTAALLT
jgi:hypothetical protein